MRKESWRRILVCSIALIMFICSLPVSYVNAAALNNFEDATEYIDFEVITEEDNFGDIDEEEDFEGTDEDFEGSDEDFEGTDEDFEGSDEDFEGSDEDFEGSDEDKPTYEVGEDAWYSLKEITSVPGAYHTDLHFKSYNYIYQSDITVLYSTSEDAIPKEKMMYENTLIREGDLKQGGITHVNSKYDYDTGKNAYTMTFAGDGTNYLSPNTTYYYRLAHKNYGYYNGTWQTAIIFESELYSFTTAEPVRNCQLSIKNIAIEPGYTKAKVNITLNNPAEEYVPKVEVKAVKADATEMIVPATLTNKNEYSATIDFNGEEELDLMVQCYHLLGEPGTLYSFSTGGDRVRPKVFKKPELTLTPLAQAILLELELENYYEADKSFDVYFRYKLPDENRYVSVGSTFESKKAIIDFSDRLSLTPNTTYDYQVIISSSSESTTTKLCEYVGTFTTEEMITYEDSAFPDEQFRKFLKNEAGIGDNEKLTNAHLQKITYIYEDPFNTELEEPIKRIEGIQYLTNLRELSIWGHEISDISCIAQLRNLELVRLNDNLISSLPDLSNLSELSSLELEYNQIPASDITADKLPDKIKEQTEWINQQINKQSPKREIVTAAYYYPTGTKRPLLVGLKSLKPGDYKVSVTMGENTQQKDYKIWSSSEIYIVNFEDMNCDAGTYNISIEVTDQFGSNQYAENREVNFTDELASPKMKKIDADVLNCDFDIYMNDNIEDGSVSLIQLCDKAGNVQGIASGDDIQYYNQGEDYDGRYENVFGSAYLTAGITCVHADVKFDNYLSSGKYDVKIHMTDGTSYTLEDVIEVAKPGKISLNKTALTMDVSDKETLKATITPANVATQKVTWSTSDSKIATVSSKGKITAKSPGEVIITATIDNGKTATCTVTVLQYKITYYLNGGENNVNNPVFYHKETSSFNLLKASRKGYEFKGWYSDKKCTKQVKSIKKGSTGNKKLYAKWSQKKYTISYKLNGGKNSSKNPSSYKITTSTITLKKPTRKGYKFVGWYSDKNYKQKVTKIETGSTGKVTLYAKWKKK